MDLDEMPWFWKVIVCLAVVSGVGAFALSAFDAWLWFFLNSGK
jgi:hypothetical protein